MMTNRILFEKMCKEEDDDDDENDSDNTSMQHQCVCLPRQNPDHGLCLFSWYLMVDYGLPWSSIKYIIYHGQMTMVSHGH